MSPTRQVTRTPLHCLRSAGYIRTYARTAVCLYRIQLQTNIISTAKPRHADGEMTRVNSVTLLYRPCSLSFQVVDTHQVGTSTANLFWLFVSIQRSSEAVPPSCAAMPNGAWLPLVMIVP